MSKFPWTAQKFAEEIFKIATDGDSANIQRIRNAVVEDRKHHTGAIEALERRVAELEGK